MNKSLLKILKRMTSDSPHDWSEYLLLALLAYRTTGHGTMGAAPFLLVYGAEARVPTELMVPSKRVAFWLCNKATTKCSTLSS